MLQRGLVWWAPVLVLGLSGCPVPYFANLARDFGSALSSSSEDLSPLLKGIGLLCRRQADIAYLRARIEEGGGQHPVHFSERHRSLFFGRSTSIEASCAALDKQVAVYQAMYAAVLGYGASLRTLGDTENADFRASFQTIGQSFRTVADTVDTQDPELGRILQEGANSINEIVHLALSAKTESDLRRAILAAAEPVGRLLDRLERVKEVYRDQVTQYTEASKWLLEEMERAALPQRGSGNRVADLLIFYAQAQRIDGEIQSLQQSEQVYLATLENLRGAHKIVVAAAQKRIPVKQAFQMVHQSLQGLLASQQNIFEELSSLRLRGRI